MTISTLCCCCCCCAELLQNFVTSLLPAHLGNESLGVLYIVVCLTVFLAPVVVDRLGARPTMVLGAACFCVYLASLIHVQRLVVLAAAVVIGFGAAILWVAFGGKPTSVSIATKPTKQGTHLTHSYSVHFKAQHART